MTAYIRDTKELGGALRRLRKQQGLTQADAAALCGVGTRFLSDLEHGKPTAHLGKVMQVMQGFGLELALVARGLPR